MINDDRLPTPKIYQIRELVPKEEEEFFWNAVYSYLLFDPEGSGYWESKVNKQAWPLIELFRRAIDEFHERGAIRNAEQDH